MAEPIEISTSSANCDEVLQFLIGFVRVDVPDVGDSDYAALYIGDFGVSLAKKYVFGEFG